MARGANRGHREPLSGREHTTFRTGRWLIGAALSAAAVLGLNSVAHAATYEVTGLDDSAAPGPAGSLRQAISNANANPGLDTIVFDDALVGAVTLSAGELQITDAVAILGPGPDTVGIDGGYSSRIFAVDPTTPGDAVTISGLALYNGFAAGPEFAGVGGAIYNVDSRLTVADALLSDNVAASGGGAIYEKAEFSDGTQTAVRNSAVVFNEADAGGGIASRGKLGSIVSTTIWGNYAANFGGGIRSLRGGATIANSTIAGNVAEESVGGLMVGFAFGEAPNTILQNTLIADNVADSGTEDLHGPGFDAEFTLIERPSINPINSTVSGSNLLGVDPRLYPYLTYRGGPTPTVVPRHDSPVIDMGMTAASVTSDQRGAPRPMDWPSFPNSAAAGADGADMGAVEANADNITPVDLTVTLAASPQPATVNQPLDLALTVHNNGPNDATGVIVSATLPDSFAFSGSNPPDSCTEWDTGTDAAYVECLLGSIASGQTETATVSVTPAVVGFDRTFAFADGDQSDPNLFNNNGHLDTQVTEPSPPPPPTPGSPASSPPATGSARGVERCKRMFRGKKRKGCIRRAKCRSRFRGQKRKRCLKRAKCRSRFRGQKRKRCLKRANRPASRASRATIAARNAPAQRAWRARSPLR